MSTARKVCVDEVDKCGSCKKAVGKNDKGIMCELCSVWFHSKCQDMVDETYKILSQDRIHFYCETCDKVVGGVVKTLADLQQRHEKLEANVRILEMETKSEQGKMSAKQSELEGEVKKIKQELREIKEGEVLKIREELREVKEGEVKKIREELRQVKEAKTGESGVKEREKMEKLQKEMGEMRTEIESKVCNTVKHMKEDVDEAMEIERRKDNIIIHGVPETDAEQDIDEVAEMFGTGLKLDFDRHMDRMHRIGKLVEGKPRPIRVMLKTKVDGKKEILSRAKQLKDHDKFKRMFISPDMTRKQQERDHNLRYHLKQIRESGETEATIRFGKIVKNGRGGRDEVLYQIE